MFLKRRIPLQEEPQAGPVGGIPEKDIVIIGDDRKFLCCKNHSVILHI